MLIFRFIGVVCAILSLIGVAACDERAYLEISDLRAQLTQGGDDGLIVLELSLDQQQMARLGPEDPRLEAVVWNCGAEAIGRSRIDLEPANPSRSVMSQPNRYRATGNAILVRFGEDGRGGSGIITPIDPTAPICVQLGGSVRSGLFVTSNVLTGNLLVSSQAHEADLQ